MDGIGMIKSDQSKSAALLNIFRQIGIFLRLRYLGVSVENALV